MRALVPTYVVMILAVVLPFAASAQALADVSLEISDNRCGFGPFGNKVYLRNSGTRKPRSDGGAQRHRARD